MDTKGNYLYLKASAEKLGLDNTTYMSDYLHNKAESFEIASKVLEAMVDTIKENNPSISEDAIDQKINEMRECL